MRLKHCFFLFLVFMLASCSSEINEPEESREVSSQLEQRENLVNPEKCPDGICDDVEISKGMCPEDCEKVAGWKTENETKSNPLMDSPKENQDKQNSKLCPDAVCDEFEKREGICREDCQGIEGWQEKSQGNQAQGFQAISAKATGAAYKAVAARPTGWFRTGQDADIMLSGIDFNNAGGPLLFNHPGEVATDGTHLLLADRNNNRVLVWNKLPSSNTPPDIVLGQKDFITNNPGKGADQMNWPVGVATDGRHVLVADTYNDRILIWNSFPSQNGQPADVVIEKNIRWPWDVWTDGKKLAVSSTGTSSVLLWNSFPETGKLPDLTLTANGKMGTPRGITSNGQYLIVADHNNKAASESATFVWKIWPTSDKPHDFLLDGWRTGTFLDNGLALISTTHFAPSIWNEVPASRDESGLQLMQATGIGNQLETGDGSDIAWGGGRLYLSLSNGNRIIAYNSIPTETMQEADFAIGADDVGANTLKTNFFMTNPVIATDGKSLFASSDFDKQLYVWKSLPDQSSAHPDFVYTFEAGSWDNALWGNTLALAGKKTIYIWKSLPLNGEMPNTISDGIGPVSFQELRGIAIDDRYFYLSDFSAGKVYVFDGIPEKNSEPRYTLTVDKPGRLSSDGKYLVVATTLDNEGGHIKIFKVEGLSNEAQPKVLNRQTAPTNLPEDALAAKGSFFIANTGGNLVYAWKDIEDAIDGKPYDTILGDSSAEDTKPEIGKNKLFWPAALAYDGSFLWVGEFKFSGRILRFSAN